MKVALVSICDGELGRFPIGLLCLNAWLKNSMYGVDVRIFDAGYEDVNSVANGDWDVIGISSMTPEYESATRLAKHIKDSGSKAVVLVGGPHISKLPSSLRKPFDAGVIGEGEQTLAEIVGLLENGQDWKETNGLVIHGKYGPTLTQPRQPIKLDGFPSLDYGAIDQRYFERHPIPIFADFGREGVIMSSRGCPYKCVFCSSGNFYKTVRYFPVSWVLNEIESLVSRGVRFIDFFDDVFAFHKPRLREIAEGIRKRGLHKLVKFYANAKADVIDDEICEILSSFNLRSIFFGFENGSERVLQYLKCGKVTIEDNIRAIKTGLRNGLDVYGNVIIGSPPEGPEDIRKTIEFIDWAWETGVSRVTASVLTPYPGTPIWETAKEMGKVSDSMDFDQLTVDIENQGLGGFVSNIPSHQFRKLAESVLAAIHKFKWRKLRMFLQNAPLETILFALKAPWPLIRRMFVRTST